MGKKGARFSIYMLLTEPYSQTCQTAKMEQFNGLKPVIIFVKGSVLNV